MYELAASHPAGARLMSLPSPIETTAARFEIIQDGQVVAEVEGPADSALTDALHYLAVYGQDGPTELRACDDESFRVLQAWWAKAERLRDG